MMVAGRYLFKQTILIVLFKLHGGEGWLVTVANDWLIVSNSNGK